MPTEGVGAVLVRWRESKLAAKCRISEVELTRRHHLYPTKYPSMPNAVAADPPLRNFRRVKGLADNRSMAEPVQ